MTNIIIQKNDIDHYNVRNDFTIFHKDEIYSNYDLTSVFLFNQEGILMFHGNFNSNIEKKINSLIDNKEKKVMKRINK